MFNVKKAIEKISIDKEMLFQLVPKQGLKRIWLLVGSDVVYYLDLVPSNDDDMICHKNVFGSVWLPLRATNSMSGESWNQTKGKLYNWLKFSDSKNKAVCYEFAFAYPVYSDLNDLEISLLQKLTINLILFRLSGQFMNIMTYFLTTDYYFYKEFFYFRISRLLSCQAAVRDISS